jgi:hypothetical protein
MRRECSIAHVCYSSLLPLGGWYSSRKGHGSMGGTAAGDVPAYDGLDAEDACGATAARSQDK